MTMDSNQKRNVLQKIAGMKDAPNYRHTNRLQRRCMTCKFFRGKETARVGQCSKYQFVAGANAVCDSWAGKKKAPSD